MYRTLIYIYKYIYINHKGGHDLSLPVQLCKSKNLKEGEIASVKLFSSELIYTVKYFIGCLVNRRLAQSQSSLSNRSVSARGWSTQTSLTADSH